jgi:hypothetical protein
VRSGRCWSDVSRLTGDLGGGGRTVREEVDVVASLLQPLS